MSSDAAKQEKSYVSNVNSIVFKPDGRVYHLELTKDEICPRVVTVGAPDRARLFSELLDKDSVKCYASSRLFFTYTGNYKGIPVSIIAIGMGAQMMDFFVREYSALHPSARLAIVRVGTCGILNPSFEPGTVLTAEKGSMYVYRNYCYFDGHLNSSVGNKETSTPYLMTAPVPCTADLDALLQEELRKQEGLACHGGVNVSADTFYASQGRNDPSFAESDENSDVVDTVVKAGGDFMEMETHQLFHLARLRRPQPIAAASCAIGIVGRGSATSITDERFKQLTMQCGEAALKAVTSYKLD